MKRAIFSAVLAFVLAGGFAFSAEPLKVFDFDGADTSSMSGIQVSSEQAKTGAASAKWENMPKQSGIGSSDIPHDWSAYDTLSFWLYSGVANGAEVMFLLYSENEDSEGADYYFQKIKLDWTGWKEWEIPLWQLGVARRPAGFNKIDSLRFAASGWGLEPKEDSVLYVDDVRLQKLGIRLRNASFEDDADGNGVPDGWAFDPKGNGTTTNVEMVDGGRTGKCVKITDQDKGAGVGINQRIPVTPGRTYEFSVWKKGDVLGVYINFYDASNKRIDPEHLVRPQNKDAGAWEQFSVKEKAPEGAATAMLWLYSFTVGEGTMFLDDAELTDTE